VASERLLVDTDVVSYLAWDRPEAKDFVPLLTGKLLFVSFATVGEMYFGAQKANWGRRRIAKMEAILERYTAVPGSIEIAQQYGRVKSAFEDQVDENDMWIASTALAHDLLVVTNNLKHFKPMSDRFEFTLVHPELDS